jgi:hypothetical protein
MLALLLVSTAGASASSAASSNSLEIGAEWTAEVSFGGAFDMPTRLGIHQLDQPAMLIHARYEVRPFELPLYYAIRVARWNNGEAWAGELVHHKIFLRDPPPEIQSFSVSHGFNLLTVERLRQRNLLLYGVGAGVVIAHPEIRVRDQVLPDGSGIAGYYLAGLSGNAVVGARHPIGESWLVSGDTRFSVSYARLPIKDGHASVTDLSVHAHLGIGYRFAREPWALRASR